MRKALLQSGIESKIVVVRGRRVMMDRDLAALYQVETRVLVQAVKRNAHRFPDDFMFRLSREEMDSLRSQIVILKNPGRGRHAKYLSYAFTENGVAMLSSVLNSKRAIQVNIQIMRAFTRMREYLATHAELATKFTELESRVGQHDVTINSIIQAIQGLLDV
jgi:phage regulator Rha-like protein